MVAEAENRIAEQIENLIAGIGRNDIGRNGAPAGSVIGLIPAKKITTGRSVFFCRHGAKERSAGANLQ